MSCLLSFCLAFFSSTILYSPTHRTSIISEFYNHVLRLLLHREASSIVADAFELYASAAERERLVMDFYGKEVQLFEAKAIPGTTPAALDAKRGLAKVMEHADVERKKRILLALKDNLINM